MKIILTGVAGFIGFNTAKRYLEEGHEVIGIDNFNSYYNPKLKLDRIALIKDNKNFKLISEDISNYDAIKKAFSKDVDVIIHLAAQAGVRYSIENPFMYERSNNLGSLNVFELARQNNIKKVVFASSSSVYGNNKKVPFSVDDPVDLPISLYAATKKYNELLAHVYSHLYGINMVGLRFFTVYGPWGRPDMAAYLFLEAMRKGEPIKVYNNGKMKRDFTYIDDIVDGIHKAVKYKIKFDIFNLGNSHTVELEYFISLIEKYSGMNAKKEYLPLQPGDVPETFSDIKKTKEKLGWEPKISVEEGLKRFVDWYNDYNGLFK